MLSKSLEQAGIDSQGWHDRGAEPGSDAGEFIDWLTIRDVHASVVTDVRRIRTHPLVPPTIPIYGYLYDVKTGALLECPRRQKSVRLLPPHDSRARRGRFIGLTIFIRRRHELSHRSGPFEVRSSRFVAKQPRLPAARPATDFSIIMGNQRDPLSTRNKPS